jgi:DNA-binding beta-propeller fold protein YncE
MDRRRFLVSTASLPLSLALGSRALASPLEQVALVTADLESHVVVLDPVAARIVARIHTAPGPRSIERVGKRTALVAHTKHGRLSIIDGAERAIRHELDGFAAPRYTALHPISRVAYVTDSEAEEVVAVDRERGRVLSRTRVPGAARHVSVGREGAVLWTALGSKAERLAVLDLADPLRPRLERTFAAPYLAHDVVFAPDGHVWVTSGDGRHVGIYRRDRQLVRLLVADRAPQHVAFVGGHALVASGDDGSVRVHDHTGRLVRRGTVPVGSYNVSVAGMRCVTPSLSRGTVSVLDASGHVLAARTVARAAHDACFVLV